MKNKIFLLLILFIFLLPLHSLAVKDSNLRKQFKVIREKSVWPVKDTSFDQIISPFGPRWMGRYDWHQGLDIKADQGTPVKAVKKGTVFAVENYSSGGKTVILRHQFSPGTKFKGQGLEYYYTFYMHLDEILVEVGQKVKKNKTIGKVGQTGNAGLSHLHLELRVGKPWGLDQAVNPMFLFPPQKNSMTLTRQTKTKFYFTSSSTQPLLNRVKLKIKNKNKYILNLNRRTGFSTSSIASLDTQDTSQPYLDPIDPSLTSDYYQTNIVIPKKIINNKKQKSLIVYDIWGRHKILSL